MSNLLIGQLLFNSSFPLREKCTLHQIFNTFVIVKNNDKHSEVKSLRDSKLFQIEKVKQFLNYHLKCANSISDQHLKNRVAY